MGQLLISYRRQDSQDYTDRIYDRFRGELGEDKVFRDLDSVGAGEDFMDVIDRTLSDTTCVLAVIGSTWLDIRDKSGSRRLDNPLDVVRTEISRALSRRIRVIPVLVGGTDLPELAELPEELRPLRRRNAVSLKDPTFTHDLEAMVAEVKAYLRMTAEISATNLTTTLAPTGTRKVVSPHEKTKVQPRKSTRLALSWLASCLLSAGAGFGISHYSSEGAGKGAWLPDLERLRVRNKLLEEIVKKNAASSKLDLENSTRQADLLSNQLKEAIRERNTLRDDLSDLRERRSVNERSLEGAPTKQATSTTQSALQPSMIPTPPTALALPHAIEPPSLALPSPENQKRAQELIARIAEMRAQNGKIEEETFGLKEKIQEIDREIIPIQAEMERIQSELLDAENLRESGTASSSGRFRLRELDASLRQLVGRRTASERPLEVPQRRLEENQRRIVENERELEAIGGTALGAFVGWAAGERKDLPVSPRNPER